MLCRKMPLLPFIWSVFFGPGCGVLNSMCNWQSPKYSRVCIGPEPGTMTIAPSSTFHFASTGRPSFTGEHHFDKSLPSNKIIASDGASPGFSAGTTLGGFGEYHSVHSGATCPPSCAVAANVMPHNAPTNKMNLFMIIMFIS